MSSATTTLGRSALASRIVSASRRPASMGGDAHGAISLAMGEPSEGTPTAIVEAAVTAFRAGRTRYSPLTGSPSLRDGLAQYLGTRHHRTLQPSQVVCTHGASAGLAAAVLALVGPGEVVVLPEPTYSLYADHVAMAGGEVVWVPNHRDGTIDVERVLQALDGARMLVLCSPGNPTGAVISGEDLLALNARAEQTGTYLLCDEAYSDIVFDGSPFFSSLDLPPAGHIVTCGTFSKAYAMTGWRLGYVIAEQAVAAAVNVVHRTFNGALSTFVQDAGVVALRTPADDLVALARSYQDRRDLVVSTLADLPGVDVAPPRGAFYAFVRVDSTLTSDELVAEMATAGVLVRSGTEFGPSGQGAFRLSFATGLEDLTEGLLRIRRVLQHLCGQGDPAQSLSGGSL